MYRLALRQATVCSALLYFALALPAAGQGRGKVKQKQPTDPSSVGGADSLNNLKFRNLGPSVAGGRVAAVVGVPGDRNVYYVGAAAGGVWKTIDGGDSWEAVFKDQPTSSIGAVALAPSNPNVVWVGTGEGNPRNDVVDGRGVFMSPDAGKSWQFMGLGDVGQVSQIVLDPANPDIVAVGPTNPSHVYALIETNEGMLWDSKDQGDHWTKVSDFHGLSARPFYFSLMHVSPVDDRKLFFSSYLLLRSDDGGKTTTPIDRGVHVDHHALWIDPQNPDRIIQGNDGGEYAVPAPSDSSILYVDSQNGNITRVDLKTGLNRSIRPYLAGVKDMKPATLQYRFNWTSPIAVSPRDANTVYLGGNVVFKSTDGGDHWVTISPDLTRNDKSRQVTSGGSINYDISGAETYNTILTVNLAPTDSNVIWVGTDDGLVQVTLDGGKTWNNVSGHFPGWTKDVEGRVYQIGVSPFDAGAAYIAIDRHQLDDRRPYVFKTSDFGKTWSDIGKGLPQDVPARVVRENPNLRGFLVLGTDAALWHSRDDGASWKPLKADFPTVPVYDVQFIKRSHDLVIATHGRGLFVLDNITALEELTPDVLASDFHVFSTLPAQIRVRPRRSGVAPARFTTPNAPAGAVIDYYLKAALDTGSSGSPGEGERGERGERGRSRRGRVIATVTDSRGDTVVVDSSGPGKQGVNRYVWNLRHAGPTRLNFEKPTGAEDEENPFRNVGGPRAIPGTYTVTVTAGGRTATQKVTVEPDPILGGDAARFAAQLRAGLEWRNAMSALNEMLNRIVSLETQLKNTQQALRDNTTGDTATAAPVARQGRELSRKLKELKDRLYNSDVQRDAGQDDIDYLNRFHDRLQGLGFGLALAYAQPPNEVVEGRMKELRAQLDAYLTRFNELLRTDVAAFNKTAQDHGTPVLVAGAPVEMKAVVLR